MEDNIIMLNQTAPVDMAALEAKEREGAVTIGERKESNISPKSINKDNVFYERVKVLLEGIEVPFSSVSISYGINGLPSCSIVLPASVLIRDLPETTKVWVLYCNPEDDTVQNNIGYWYVLFDGELGSMSYSYHSNGGVLMFNVNHTLSLLDNIQLCTQEAVSRLMNVSNSEWSGISTVATTNGLSIQDSAVLHGLFGKAKNKFKSMADIVASLIKTTINNESEAAATQVAYERVIKNEKLPDRIYGIDTAAVNEAVSVALSSMKGATNSGNGDDDADVSTQEGGN